MNNAFKRGISVLMSFSMGISAISIDAYATDILNYENLLNTEIYYNQTKNASNYIWNIEPSIEADDIIVSDDSFDVSQMNNKGSDKYSFIERDGKYNFISYDGKIALNTWYDEPTILELGELGLSSTEGAVQLQGDNFYYMWGRGASADVYYVYPYDKNTSQIYHPVAIGNPQHWGSECKYSCDYGTAILIEEATVKANKNSYAEIDYTGKYGAAYKNKVTVAPDYDNGIMNVYNNMIALKSGNKWGYFNGKTGKQIIDFIADEFDSKYYNDSIENYYTEARPYTYSNGYVAINNSNGWALYNERGKAVIDYGEFEQIRPVHNNKAWVKDKETSLWGVIEITEEVSPDAEKYAQVVIDNEDKFSDMLQSQGILGISTSMLFLDLDFDGDLEFIVSRVSGSAGATDSKIFDVNIEDNTLSKLSYENTINFNSDLNLYKDQNNNIFYTKSSSNTEDYIDLNLEYNRFYAESYNGKTENEKKKLLIKSYSSFSYDKAESGNKIKTGQKYGGTWIEDEGYVSRYMNTFVMNEDGSSVFKSASFQGFPRIINFESSVYENGVYHLSDGTFQDGNSGTYTGITGTVTVNDDGSISFSSSTIHSDENMIAFDDEPIITTTTEITTETTTTTTTTDNVITITTTIYSGEVAESGSCGENVNWELYENGVLRIFGEGDMRDYSYELVKTTNPPWYDMKENIYNIVIEDGVTSIGNRAFADCKNVRSIYVPDSVNKIGYFAFSYCKNLTSITLPDSIKEIENHAFEHCFSLVSVVIPENVTKIGEQAFRNCKDMSFIIVPASLKCISSRAFEGCENLKDVYYAGTAKQANEMTIFLGNDCYTNADIHISSTGPTGIYEGQYTRTGTFNNGLMEYEFYPVNSVLRIYGTGEMTNCDSYPWYAFKDDIKQIVIEDGIKTIGWYAFEDCKNLVSVTMPKNLTEIGIYAFNNCTSLRAISLPAKITGIEYSAFENCISLSSVKIPDGVKEIGGNAFKNCTSLSNIEIPESTTYIGVEAFNGCNSLKHVYFGGTDEQWKNELYIDELNESLVSADKTYGKLSDKERRKNNIQTELKNYKEKMNYYLETVKKKANNDKEKVNGNSNYLTLMQKEEENPDDRLLIFYSLHGKEIPKEAKEDAYEVLYEFLTRGIEEVEKNGTLDIDNDDNIVEIEAGIINQIYDAAVKGSKSPGKGRGSHGYTVDLKVLGGLDDNRLFSQGVRFGDGSITRGKESYGVAYCSNLNIASRTMSNYMEILCNTVKDQYKTFCFELVDAFRDITTIKEINEEILKSKLEDLKEYLIQKGYGNLYKDICDVKEAYDSINEVLDFAEVNNVKDLFDKISGYSIEDDDADDPLIDLAIEGIESTREKLESALFDYVYETDYYERGEKITLLDKIVAEFQCPVNIEIMEPEKMDSSDGYSYRIVGYVNDGDVYSDGSINVEFSDDVKIIELPKDKHYIINLSGTDNGSMNIIYKDIEHGIEKAYVSFYDVPLKSNLQYTQEIDTSVSISGSDFSTLVSEDGTEIEPSEYFDSDNKERFIDIEIFGNYGGIITGNGKYTRGESVALEAHSLDGYYFAGWYEDDVLINLNPLFRFTALADCDIEARFEKIRTEDISCIWTIDDKYKKNTAFWTYKNENRNTDIEFAVYKQLADSPELTAEIVNGNTTRTLNLNTSDNMYYSISDISLYNNEIINIYDSENNLVASMKKDTFGQLKLGDVDGDGLVNAVDASMVAIEYANRSVCMEGADLFDEIQNTAGDVNSDGRVDAVDASIISMFYAYLSTDGTETDLKAWADIYVH